MIYTTQLEEMISYILYSSYLIGDKSVSLLIMAQPESGKTTALSKFKQNNGTAFISDLTYSGMIELLPRFERRELRTILIPDMLKLLSRKATFSANLVTFMNEFIEEGISAIYTYKTTLRFETPVRGNFIACVTSGEALNNLGYWTKVGFVSRLIPFSYGYSNEAINKIFEFIISGHHTKDIYTKLKLPKKEKEVTLSPELAKDLMLVSTRIATEAKLFGFRIQKNLQTLSKAVALYNGETEVTKQHIDKVIKLTNWMNLKFTPLE